MQFGLVVHSIHQISNATDFDYLEPDVNDLLRPNLPDDEWSLPKVSTPIRAVHSLIPASLPITGPEVDLPALRLHVQRACERAAQLGVRVITLSSPAALRIPDGFDPKQAKSQILDFLRTAVPFFARHELMLVAGVNPPDECNVMITLPEVLQYVWQMDHPWFQCLLDVGLVSSGVVTMDQVKDALPWVRHVHIPVSTNIGHVVPELNWAKYQDLVSLNSPAGAEPEDASRAAHLLMALWTAP